jgi:hypothetical protein
LRRPGNRQRCDGPADRKIEITLPDDMPTLESVTTFAAKRDTVPLVQSRPIAFRVETIAGQSIVIQFVQHFTPLLPT